MHEGTTSRSDERKNARSEVPPFRGSGASALVSNSRSFTTWNLKPGPWNADFDCLYTISRLGLGAITLLDGGIRVGTTVSHPEFQREEYQTMTQKGHLTRTIRIHCMVSLLLLLGPWAVSQAQELPPEIVQYADMVLHNGRVLPMDRDQPPLPWPRL